MKNIVLAGKNSLETSQRLADALGFTLVKYGHPFEEDVNICIRYGNRTLSVNSNLEFNTLLSVQNTADKKVMMDLFLANDVPVPPLITSGYGFYRNSKGVTKLKSNIEEGDVYGTKRIEKVKEYRVHVFNGSIISVMEKIQRSGMNTIYSKLENSIFKKVDIYDTQISDYSIKAINACGLIFGGVDIIYDGHQYYVLEANSACGLGPKNVELWEKHITQYINGNRN